MACISSYTCDNCQARMECDSLKAGTNDGDTYYIDGPCCCIRANWGECPKCGHVRIKPRMNELTTIHVTPQALEDIKRWSIVEKDTRPPIFNNPVDKSE
jgi:hypothetical protein